MYNSLTILDIWSPLPSGRDSVHRWNGDQLACRCDSSQFTCRWKSGIQNPSRWNVWVCLWSELLRRMRGMDWICVSLLESRWNGILSVYHCQHWASRVEAPSLVSVYLWWGISPNPKSHYSLHPVNYVRTTSLLPDLSLFILNLHDQIICKSRIGEIIHPNNP